MDREALKKQLILDEAIRCRPYSDSVGKLTIGIGRNLTDNGITKEEALFLCDGDIARACSDLDEKLPWWSGLDEARQGVLANMCFNMGISRLLGFRNFLTALQAKDYQTAAAEMLKSLWAHEVGDRAKRLEAVMLGGKGP